MKVFALVICFIWIAVGCTSKVQTDYPSVSRLNGHNYAQSVETVPSANIGKQIGTIKKLVKTMPKKDYESNEFPKGSKLYEIKDKETSDVFAILANGEYHLLRKMVYSNE